MRRGWLLLLGLLLVLAVLFSDDMYDAVTLGPTPTPAITPSETPTFPLSPTATSTPTPPPTPQATPTVESALLLQKLDSGQLVDLFPGSEVFRSERGDVVVMSKLTGMRLAGQEVETQFGRFTFLIQDTLYQRTYENHFNESTTYGGYPNLIESPLKEEISRIISALVQLGEKQIGFDKDLSAYQPSPTSVVYIEILIGRTITLSQMMPERLFDTELTRSRSAQGAQYRLLRTKHDEFVQIKSFTSLPHSPNLAPQNSIQVALAQMPKRIFFALMREAVAKLGYDTISFNNKYLNVFGGVLESPFWPLFSHSKIDEGMGGKPGEPTIYVLAAQEAKFGIPSVVEIDFDSLSILERFVTSRQITQVPISAWSPHETPPLFDDFSDTNLHASRWRVSSEHLDNLSYSLDDGALVLQSSSPATDVELLLTIVQPASRSIHQASTYEAKMMIHRQQAGNYGSVHLMLGANVPGRPWWLTLCTLGSPFFYDKVHFNCIVSSGVPEYSTQSLDLQYDKWYTVRIEINPENGHLQFYLDGELLDTYRPRDSASLTAATFSPYIRFFAKPRTSFGVDIDDVRISE